MSDPLLFSLVQDLEFQTGYRIKQVVATRTDILEAIENGYPDKALAKYTGGGAAAGLTVLAPHATAKPGRPGRPRVGRARSARRRRRVRAAGGGGRGRARGQRLGADHRPRRSRREQRDHQPRERRAHRADGEGGPRPASPRRHPEGSDGPAEVGPRRARRAHEDHGGHGHRREAAAAGRPPPDQDRRRQGRRLPRLDAADDVRREDRPARARSPEGRAAARGARPVGRRDGGAALLPPPPARHDPGRRPDRQRQDHDAQLRDQLDQVGPHQHHHDRGSDRVSDPRRQPDAGQREGEADVRQRAARDPAPGSRRHPRRRDPRSGNGEDRDAGRADGPPRALDAAHRRRAVDDDAADGHGHRAVRDRVGAGRRRRAAAGAAAVRRVPPAVHAGGRDAARA